MTVFRVVPVRQDLDFGDDLLAVALGFSAGALPGDTQAVHLVAGGVVAGRPGADVARVAARAGNQRDQVKPVAAVQRQRLHLLGIDVSGQLGFLRVDNRRLAADRHRFLQRRDFHREVDRRRLADSDSESLPQDAAETGQFSRHFVGPERQGGHQVGAVRPGRRRSGGAGLDVVRRHGHARQHRAAFVDDGAAQLTLRELRECRGSRDGDEDDNDGQSGVHESSVGWCTIANRRPDVKFLFPMAR